MRRIAIVSSTRADWGLLSPLASALREEGMEVGVIAANMHLSEDAGHTVEEIRADGFEPVAEILPGDNQVATAALTMAEAGRALEAYGPDAVVILGDRYEMPGVAVAAVILGIPVVHIAGGAVSEGAFDDSFRHALTKLATLHLVETEENRGRVIQMGEDPDMVVTTGAIGVYNLFNTPALSREELEKSIGFDLGERSLLVTLHAATLGKLTLEEQMAELLAALDTVPEAKVIFTNPNNDTDPRQTIEMIKEWCSERPGRGVLVPSLGRVRFLSALRCVDAVVGNSSSGLVEVPSAGIPTVDIGVRQQGRLAGPSVIHCGSPREEISGAIARALSPEMKMLAAKKENPYARPDTLRLMVDAIRSKPLPRFPKKKFHYV